MPFQGHIYLIGKDLFGHLWYIKQQTALCTVVFFMFNTQITGLVPLCWWQSCLHPSTVPHAIVVGRAALPQRQTFLHKNIPQSANLLLHLSGSHLATHKLHYSFFPYLASSSVFFTPVAESFWLQTSNPKRSSLHFSGYSFSSLWITLVAKTAHYNCQAYLAT